MKFLKIISLILLIMAVLFMFITSGIAATADPDNPDIPVISEVLPKDLTVGDQVTITGVNFGTHNEWLDNQSGYQVKFDKQQSMIDSWSDTWITCIIPTGINNPSELVIYAVGKKSKPIKLEITRIMINPTIDMIFPDPAMEGSIVTVQGTGFGDIGDEITFDGILSDYTDSWTDNQIVCQIPWGVNNPSWVEVGGRSAPYQLGIYKTDGP